MTILRKKDGKRLFASKTGGFFVCICIDLSCKTAMETLILQPDVATCANLYEEYDRK